MKKTLILLAGLLAAAALYAQKIPNNVRERLDPILAAVIATDAERVQLIEAIREFQTRTAEARRAGDKAGAAEVRKRYDAELREILGAERYAAVEQAERELRQAEKHRASASRSVARRLIPILRAVTATDAERVQLIEAIREFQTRTAEARRAGDKAEAVRIDKRYRVQLVEILGAQRYDAVRKAEKAAREQQR